MLKHRALSDEVSIHAPREGCDTSPLTSSKPSSRFQFTHPGRGATRSSTIVEARLRFQFTHPGRGATSPQVRSMQQSTVSIHAPREGCDPRRRCGHGSCRCFNSRTPGGVRLGRASFDPLRTGFNSRTPGGVRLYSLMGMPKILQFQFTHPGRGATSPDRSEASSASRFNSRTPGGVRLARVLSDEIPAYVSIHAPREGCDSPYRSRIVWSAMFQFTHPGRGATLCDDWLPSCSRFQFTHPGRGATKTVDVPAWAGKKFQFTHPGRGATEGGDVVDVRSGKFQFTHPGRGATFSWSAVKRSSRVSIHAPREGCDQRSNHAIRTASSFQFTHPGRGATKAGEDAMEGWHKFQFTHPGRGATLPRSPQ